MSRVYFHSPSGTAELMGSEFHYLRGLIYNLALGVLKVDDYEHAKRLRGLLPAGDSLRTAPFEGYDFQGWVSYYETRFRVAGDDDRSPLIEWRGERLSAFSLALNTAAALGSDAVKLATRIVGQGEIHAWIDGPNRAWVATIMQVGLESGTYRTGIWFEPVLSGERQWADQGWGDVIAFLRARNDEPVVMSYSVSGGFPNAHVAGVAPEDDWSEEYEGARQAFDELPDTERWRLGVQALRASSKGLEIKPDDWGSFRYTHQLSVLDLVADDWEDRLRLALDLDPASAGQ